VFVNGKKVSRQRLKSQDQIRIGSTVLLFTMKEE
jgi:pSer/pThr/pTyr-binding forkhead associated (FHA) protein